MAMAVAVAVSGGGAVHVAVPVAVPVAGLIKRSFNYFSINVWGYLQHLDALQHVLAIGLMPSHTW